MIDQFLHDIIIRIETKEHLNIRAMRFIKGVQFRITILIAEYVRLEME